MFGVMCSAVPIVHLRDDCAVDKCEGGGGVGWGGILESLERISSG